jgi:hypothetical protein
MYTSDEELRNKKIKLRIRIYRIKEYLNEISRKAYYYPLTNRRKNVNSLEIIIDKFNLILNNELGAIIRLNARENNSIINLTFITTSIRLLNS